MSEELLIRHCSPTLAGIKTGNLFSCKSRCREEVIAHIRKFNTLWQAKGLCALLLRHRNGRALIYVFRPHELEMDLSSSEAKRLLAEMGYCCTKPWHCLAELQCRLEKNKEFPHEIGLFLSYPPEDVAGFINGSVPCKCVGCWKVYSDEKKACLLFEKYRRCAHAYYRQWSRGVPFEHLIVTTKQKG